MLAIAFEGCACRAAFHAGVAAALARAGVVFRLASGSSSGSLIAAAVATGRAPELPDIWQQLAGRSLFSVRRALWNRSPFDMSHLVRGALRALLGRGDLRSAPAEALASASLVPRFRGVVYSSREEADFVEPLLGSCFVPPFYGRPVRVRGQLLFDGGFTDNLPIEPLVDRGATEIVAVVASPRGVAFKCPNVVRWAPASARARVQVICPLRPLPIGVWDFRRAAVAEALGEGVAAAERFLAQRRALTGC